MRTTLLSLLFLPSLIGCTSDSDSADENSVDIVAKDYTLQPGEEKYYCYTTRMPAGRDIAFTKLTPTYGAGTHHILLAQAFATEPEGFSECEVLFRQTWLPMYTGGLDSGPVEMPAGVGFSALEPGQQIIMQLHLQNATDRPITASTKVHIEFVDKTPDLVEAGIYGMDNRVIDIPPNTEAKRSDMNCVIGHGMDVFAVLGHMHKRGSYLDISRGETAGVEMLYQEEWKFETQPVTPMNFRVNENDRLHLRCTHKNNSGLQIGYGESSDDEMCAFVMYYAPADGQLDGCIQQ